MRRAGVRRRAVGLGVERGQRWSDVSKRWRAGGALRPEGSGPDSRDPDGRKAGGGGGGGGPGRC